MQIKLDSWKAKKNVWYALYVWELCLFANKMCLHRIMLDITDGMWGMFFFHFFYRNHFDFMCSLAWLKKWIPQTIGNFRPAFENMHETKILEMLDPFVSEVYEILTCSSDIKFVVIVHDIARNLNMILEIHRKCPLIAISISKCLKLLNVELI